MHTLQRLDTIASAGGLVSADLCFGNASESQVCQFTRGSSDAASGVFNDQRRYLVASLTKPITAMAIVKLAAEGELSLAEPFNTFLPGFKRADLRRTTVRHLLTHTSGFPDMLPNNTQLRAEHASLDEFVGQAANLVVGSTPVCSIISMLDGLLGNRLSFLFIDVFFARNKHG